MHFLSICRRKSRAKARLSRQTLFSFHVYQFVSFLLLSTRKCNQQVQGVSIDINERTFKANEQILQSADSHETDLELF